MLVSMMCPPWKLPILGTTKIFHPKPRLMMSQKNKRGERIRVRKSTQMMVSWRKSTILKKFWTLT